MNYKSLQLKIIIIFSVPTIALIYFSFSFINSKYEEYNTSSSYALSSKITYSLSKLIHNIQLERGLSAGYLVSKDENLKTDLIKQYKYTDKSYKEFVSFIKIQSSEQKRLYGILGYKNTPYIRKMIKEFHRIKLIREDILNLSIKFEDEINYYTTINKQLLNSINIFMIYLSSQLQDSNALFKLQNLKEMVGLERAYVYNQILSKEYNDKYIQYITELQEKQKILKKKFDISASIHSMIIFNEKIKLQTTKELNSIRKDFFLNTLTKKDAKRWFKVSSQYINQLDNASNKILHVALNHAIDTQDDARRALLFTAILWILSLISFLFLVYILKNLIDKEESMMDKLRIASYTFDSHEAMAITDVNGTILKINQAFTDITGYNPNEVIGKNPRVLKSDKHDAEFYKNMWHKLHTIGKWTGEIYNKRKNGEVYPERLSITAIKNDIDVTTHYIAQFLDITDLKNAQKNAEHQADHDFLTGILNRKALMKRLQEEFVKARRHNFTHSFLFIDLDNFKPINDTHGHNIGDKLLIEVTKRIKALLREEDIFSRISGDEFAIILLNIDRKKQDVAMITKAKCEKIIDELSKDFIIDEYKMNIGASIGIKIFPDGEKNIQDVIINADTAMYQAKKSGKNKHMFFNKTIELELKQLSLLEEELNLAYENKEFKFYLQPKVDVKTEKICGAEALIRWQHPQKGILYPNSFLKVATEMGMLPKITKLALNDICDFISKNTDVFDGVISINIGSNELLDPEFENDIISIINKYNVNTSQIELEILEDDLIKDLEIAIVKINSLKKLGINLSIDDFGTGYSSITYLKKLPVNCLKIDRHFTQNLHESSNKELIKMMINMAKTFNMRIVIEGVESESQLKFIKENGADQYQGFYCSKAIDQKSFIQLLKK